MILMFMASSDSGDDHVVCKVDPWKWPVPAHGAWVEIGGEDRKVDCVEWVVPSGADARPLVMVWLA